jgi:AcrR family transcriptional regulator
VGREARDDLLTAALRVFARRGYRDAGVDEIAAEAATPRARSTGISPARRSCSWP